MVLSWLSNPGTSELGRCFRIGWFVCVCAGLLLGDRLDICSMIAPRQNIGRGAIMKLLSQHGEVWVVVIRRPEIEGHSMG